MQRMRDDLKIAFAFCALLAPPSVAAAPFAYVSNANSNNVSVLDTASITLGSWFNPSMFREVVIFTAVVSGSSGRPTGTIVFLDNGVAISGCAGLAMANGSAICRPSMQSVGTHSITAVYSGDSTYAGETSSVLPQVVNAAKPNTPNLFMFGSSVNPSTVGQYVEFTGVLNGIAGIPTGTLFFFDDGEVISGCGGIPIAWNGKATCTPGNLSQGTHYITTVYSGDSIYNRVTSAPLPQTVGAAKANTPSFTLGSSQNPLLSGGWVTFTAVLSGAAGTPTGNVVFRDNGMTITGCAGIALTNGSVTCSPLLAALGFGFTHSITGIYQGDGNYNGVTSSVLPQAVQ